MVQQQQQQQQQQQHYPFDYLASLSPSLSAVSDSSKSTLWIGDLEAWMDENFIRQLWASLGENVIAKVIRDKRTGAGYAFVEFESMLAAQRALVTFHGVKVHNMQKPLRLNWASGGGIHDRKEDRAPEYSLFVGDLSGDVDETLLLSLFRQHYPSCHSAKVMSDPLTGMSRGYGFVRFHDPREHQNALIEMNGVYCSNRPMRVSLATPKNSNARYHQLALQAPALVHQATDPSNTTVFIGGLSATPISEDELRQYFAPYGDIVYVKIPPNKGCGFVQYVSRHSAEMAIEQMNGFQIGASRIRLSWGRSQNDKTTIAAAQQQNWQHQPSNIGQHQHSSLYTSPTLQPSIISPSSSTILRRSEQNTLSPSQHSRLMDSNPVPSHSVPTFNRRGYIDSAFPSSFSTMSSLFQPSQRTDNVFAPTADDMSCLWPDSNKRPEHTSTTSNPTSGTTTAPGWHPSGIYAQ